MKLLTLLLCVLPAFAQPWSGILAPARAVDWGTAGLPSTLPDGETTANPWTPPVRTQCGSTVAGGTSVATLNSLFAACSTGTYLLLGSGSFTINSNLNIWGAGVTLRGSGPQSTTLNLSGSAVIQIGAASGAGSGLLTSDSTFAAGSSTVKIGSISGLGITTGNIVTLSQCDTGFSGTPCTGTATDNSGLYICGDTPGCMTEPSSTNNGQHQYETFYVTNVADNGTGATCGSTHCYTLTLDHTVKLPNWAYAQSPIVNWESTSYQALGVGLEDMTVSSSTSDNFVVSVQYAYGSWMKGVRIIGNGGGNATLGVNTSVHWLANNNYLFANYPLGVSYTPWQLTNGSFGLFLNNILTSGSYWMGLGGNVGNVFAFNFARDMFTQYTENSFFDHHAFDAFDITEGNQLGVIHEDDTWGTHGLNTHFRNYAVCDDSPYTTWTVTSGSYRGIVISGYQRFMNLVGNAIGTAGVCTSYQGSGFGTIFQFDGSDTLTTNSVMRWGNASVVTQSSDTPTNSGIRFLSSEAVPATLTGNAAPYQATTPGSDTLPASFFMDSMTPHPSGGTGLNWWKVCTSWATFPTSCSATQIPPMPVNGPDVTGGPYVLGHAYDNTTSIAWHNLPVDSNYQTSYTVTASSWSGGTETLTVSSLPNMQSLLGPFQLNGVNAACSAGATFGNSSEILMTGSTSTTVQYALTSNPSVQCTGTMLFPDVRQFDERVYSLDNGPTPGGGQLGTGKVAASYLQ